MTMRAEIVRDAAIDAIALLFGAMPSARFHPSAAGLACEDGFRSISAALTQADFGTAFAGGLGIVIGTGYAATDTHRRICRLMELKDFQVTPTSDIDIEIDKVLDAVGKEESEGVDLIVKHAAGLNVALKRKSFVIGFTPEVVKNDATGATGLVLSGLGAACNRRERRGVFGSIVANPVLADGRTVYNATDANSFASALNSTTLGVACGMLARQKTRAGNELGALPAFLLVNPENWVSALSVVKEFTLDGAAPPIEVIAVPEISNVGQAAWYLFADPAIAPVVALNTLRGREGQTIFTRASQNFRSSAPMVAVDHIFGTAILSRVGTVRGGV